MTKTNRLPAHDFNLREIVAEVCETHHEADPARLVGYVLGQIAVSDYEEALAQALPGFITAFVTRARSTQHPDDEPSTGRKIGKPRLNGLSKFLYDREFSPARNGWVLRADVNEEDARSMAVKREAAARHFLELATWYELVADTIRDNGVETIGDLSVMVQESLRTSRPS